LAGAAGVPGAADPVGAAGFAAAGLAGGLLSGGVWGEQAIKPKETNAPQKVIPATRAGKRATKFMWFKSRKRGAVRTLAAGKKFSDQSSACHFRGFMFFYQIST
jgi:hypothetical protein